MKKKILVVDDDEDFLSLVLHLLNQEGYDATGITNGISIIEEKIALPDLFIFDKHMEFIDGIAISKFVRMRPRAKHIPIIMLSAGSNRQHAAKAGIDYYLDKPFKTDELLAIIKHCLIATNSDEQVYT